MRKITEKERNNIPYELHESNFICYSIKDKNLILRFAINCALVDTLEVECEFGEKYYLYDAICYDFEKLECYNIEMDLLLREVLSFIIYENKYDLCLQAEGNDVIDFKFDCSHIEWIPIKILSGDELEEIGNTEYCKID